MMPVGGRYADPVASRWLLVDNEYCVAANCGKAGTGADVLRGYEAFENTKKKCEHQSTCCDESLWR